MPITETAISSISPPIFKLTKRKEPQSINPHLPPLFFSCLIVGAKNSGKTFAATQILKLFEENEIHDINGNKLQQRIIIFSPTAKNESNIVFKNLKNLDDDDIHLEYSDELLDEILIELKENVDEVNEYDKYIKLLHKFEKTKEELTDEEYYLLYKNNFEPIEEKRHTITHFIFDDLIGDRNTFKKSRDNVLVKFLLKHRHLYTNIFITSQYVNAIPPIIKNNIDIFNIFKYANLKDIISKFYPVVSGIMLENEFKELYSHATQDKFNFLTVISHNALKGRLLIRKNWNIDLNIN
jgi:hypothetical protein